MKFLPSIELVGKGEFGFSDLFFVFRKALPLDEEHDRDYQSEVVQASKDVWKVVVDLDGHAFFFIKENSVDAENSRSVDRKILRKVTPTIMNVEIII